MAALDRHLADALDAIAARGETRRLRPAEPLPGGRIRRDGRVLLDFSSNDYLGLAGHPLLIERARDWTARAGTGARASRLVTGTSGMHLAVEAKLAAFKRAERALVLASGWQANAAVLAALIRAAPGAQLFADRLIHASLHVGIAAAGARQTRFRHNDLDHLAALLGQRDPARPAIIVTESVFGMDGDTVDLPRLAALASAHDAFLYLDEAHATGVRGPEGRGLSATLPGGVDLAMGTFSKALGGFGGYVAGGAATIDYLVNACGGFVFTTAPPPAMLGAIDAALDLVPGMDAERARLARHGDRLRAMLGEAGYDSCGSTTQIVPAIVGEAGEALALSARLEATGLLCAAIRPPTVPPGTSRLRLALGAAHEEEDVERLGETAGGTARAVPRVTLLFAHGWGFDASLWDGLRATLGAWPSLAIDRGYFGAPSDAGADGPVVAIGHSLGALLLLLAPPPGCARSSRSTASIASRAERGWRRASSRAWRRASPRRRARCSPSSARAAARPRRSERSMRRGSRPTSRSSPKATRGARPRRAAARARRRFGPDPAAGAARGRLRRRAAAPPRDPRARRPPAAADGARLVRGADRRAAGRGGVSPVARAFDRAERYDAHAGVQREAARRLADTIAALPLPPRPRVLEIGCGTGFLAEAVGDRLAAADWTMTDVAPAMVARARARFAGRPGYRFAMLDGGGPIDGRFDLVCSSLAAQWFGDLPGAIARQRAALGAGGRLAFATLAAGSLDAWRDAHRARGLVAGTPDYPSPAALRLLGAERVESVWLEERHADGRAFLRALRAIGAGTPRAGHRPLRPAELRAVLRAFEDGGATARYHVATCVFGPPA